MLFVYNGWLGGFFCFYSPMDVSALRTCSEMISASGPTLRQSNWWRKHNTEWGFAARGTSDKQPLCTYFGADGDTQYLRRTSLNFICAPQHMHFARPFGAHSASSTPTPKPGAGASHRLGEVGVVEGGAGGRRAVRGMSSSSSTGSGASTRSSSASEAGGVTPGLWESTPAEEESVASPLSELWSLPMSDSDSLSPYDPHNNYK